MDTQSKPHKRMSREEFNRLYYNDPAYEEDIIVVCTMCVANENPVYTQNEQYLAEHQRDEHYNNPNDEKHYRGNR